MDHIRQRNSIIGLTLGDAWGASSEFFPFEDMQDTHYLAESPHVKMNGDKQDDLFVTDDTHMSIHVYRALNTILEKKLLTEQSYDTVPADLMVQHERVFLDEFLAWRDSPLNTYSRAPGNTCMSSLLLFSQAREMRMDLDSSLLENDSMGSGTVMRSAWIGTHPRIPDNAVKYLSHLQSELTHKHALGAPPAVIQSLLVRELVRGELELDRLIERAQELCEVHGYAGLLGYLETCEEVSKTMLDKGLLDYDPCSDLGGGWIAPETLALGLSIAQAYADSPTTALRRSALTGGDSDTIGAVAGALVGAGHSSPIPEWEELFSHVEEPFKSDMQGFIDNL